MYNYIEGKVVEKNIEKNLCIVDVNNIGYEIVVSETTLKQINISEITKFYIVEISSGLYSSGLPTLYGFLSKEEKEIFLAFKDNLSNVGPKKALEYLDKVKKNITEFKLAIKTKNYKSLTSLFGFKHSSAEKIVSALSSLELFTKEEMKEGINIEIYTDLVSALTNLGYKEQQVKDIVEKILTQNKIILKDIKKTQDYISQFLPLILKELSSTK
ncbi:MAG: Holliday junction branch migration protein RuvA [Endomicrobiia bacterium]